MCEPRKIHLVAMNHVLRYLRGTVGCGLRYISNSDLTLVSYSDSDWAGSVKDRKSSFGCCFSLGSAMVSWFSGK